MGGYPLIVQGSLRILGVHGYSDTGSQSYKWISSVQGSLGTLGVCGYSVGRGWTSLDSQNIQGILGVHGYSDTGC